MATHRVNKTLVHTYPILKINESTILQEQYYQFLTSTCCSCCQWMDLSLQWKEQHLYASYLVLFKLSRILYQHHSDWHYTWADTVLLGMPLLQSGMLWSVVSADLPVHMEDSWNITQVYIYINVQTSVGMSHCKFPPSPIIALNVSKLSNVSL